MRAPAVRSVAALAIVLLGSTAQAQSAIGERLSLEFVGAVNTSTTNFDEPFVFLDLTATGRITDDLDVVVRPYARRLPGGNWSKEMYQLQVRYQPSTRVPVRIDAGIISSPLGLIALEMRPDRNPVIPHRLTTSRRCRRSTGGKIACSCCRAAIRSARWRASRERDGMHARA